MGALFLVAACLETFGVLHSASPLSEMRKLGIAADDFPVVYRAAEVDPARMKPLGRFGELLWVDGSQVIADRRRVSDLTVVDGTRLRAGERAVVGKWMGPREPRAAARLLLETGVIRTYWHLESTVCLEAESDKDGVWEGRYSGEHVYFTSKRNTGAFRFAVRVEADGTLAVAGR